ncbi:Hypothetical protein LCAKO_2p11 (plasmid) [Lacticaseibacillus paracasei subsp. paracasei]|uniref:Uncharacterized protein n=1 Tax=Lacticaseibacillus paracasei subsp. paracasei TaxID=47714 RepID=A0AAP9HKE5_LACPA|nr:Hypothetical protein LCAKO_2p11 [Lacticaseibacillus paracasei subsp. paracasei]
MRIRKTVTLDTNLEGFANPEDVQKYMDQNDLKTLSAALLDCIIKVTTQKM